MNKSQRLIAVMMTLNSKRKYTLKQLAEQFQVSKRTMLRDLQDLEMLGVPLFAEYGVNGGYQVIRERTLPPIQFSEGEAVALFFACQSLEHYGALPFQDESRTALNKFLLSLPEDTKERIARLKERLRFWVPTQAMEQPYLRILLDAALDRTMIEGIYESESGVRSRKLLPLGVYAMNGLWYCSALDAESGKVKVYRTDRFSDVRAIADMTDASVTDSLQDERADYSVDRWLGPQDDESTLELEVVLTRRGVLRCQSDIWLAEGLRVLDDGTGRISRRMSESYVGWAASFFTSLGADARVLKPAEVRHRIKAIMHELESVYSD